MIDRDHLARMMDGDYEVADRFIRSFRNQITTQIPQLQTYLEQQDYELLANTAHIVKTQAGYVRLTDLAGLAQFVEDAAASAHSHERIRELTGHLVEAMELVLRTMDP